MWRKPCFPSKSLVLQTQEKTQKNNEGPEISCLFGGHRGSWAEQLEQAPWERQGAHEIWGDLGWGDLGWVDQTF
jgi:hypothetical protein